MMSKRINRTMAVVGGLAVMGLGGGAFAQAGSGGDDAKEKASGPGADKAKAAALQITGGKANSVERDRENGATWEVEVTKSNGQTVDVRLDGNYKQVVIEVDKETERSK